ncbi:MAG TPA: hypothetical protein VH394_28535 [Thermoanaerobaculia bacterium]|jgi:hypothetical protein|nr:hypothetical protein [Thermoanaerobaculia bacterium]
MANISLVLGRGLQLQLVSGDATVTKRTVTLPPGTFTVTLSPGPEVSFSGTILPTLTSTNDAIILPSSAVSLTGASYVVTCTNNLTTGASAARAGFGMTVTVDDGSPKDLNDPTMIFDPPG